MIYFLFLFVLAAIIAVFVYLSILNPQLVDIHLGTDTSLSMGLPQILLFSFMSGMLLMALGSLLREGRRAFRNWRESRQIKGIQRSDELYHRGVEHFIKGNYIKAAELFSGALDKYPANIKPYLRLSEIHALKGNYSEAIKVLNKGRQFDGDNLEILFKLSENSFIQGDLSGAEEVLEKILSLDQEDREALRRLRNIYEKGKRWEDAYRIEKTITSLSKGTADYSSERKTKGRVKYCYAMELSKKGDGDKALRKLRDVLKLDPEFVPAHMSIGDIFLGRAERDNAREAWEEGYKKLGNAAFLLRIEDMYLKEEEPETLVNFYIRLVTERPDDLTARLFFGKLCLRLEMVEEAREQLSFIESHGKATPYLHHLLGEMHMRRQRFADAAEEFKKAAGVGRTLLIPFVCSSCHEEFSRYSPQCPSCQKWNTIVSKAQKESFARTELAQPASGERPSPPGKNRVAGLT